MNEYLQALSLELELRLSGTSRAEAASGAQSGARPVLDTLYFGGGTPSRLGGDGIARAIEAVHERADLSNGAEVTIEVNPEDVTAAAVEAWLRAGVNRLSIGVQSFHDDVLQWMHRTHDAAGAARAVAVARDAGLVNYSLDLIFALPESLERDWARDVDCALALEPAHLSLYGLTVEPHTPLGRWRAGGRVTEAGEDSYESEFLHAHEALARAGLEHYEVSNFAVPGRRSRHNSVYWSGEPYAAAGPSAHSFDGSRRRWNASGYVDWLRRLCTGEDPTAGSELLTGESVMAEEVYLGLRTVQGLRLRPGEMEHVSPWMEQGWGVLNGSDRLVLTALGWLRLDALAADLTLLRSR